MNNYKNYISVGDLKKALEEFPDEMKVFFFDRDKDNNFSFSDNITFDHYSDVGFPDENGKEVREEVLAFVREMK